MVPRTPVIFTRAPRGWSLPSACQTESSIFTLPRPLVIGSIRLPTRPIRDSLRRFKVASSVSILNLRPNLYQASTEIAESAANSTSWFSQPRPGATSTMRPVARPAAPSQMKKNPGVMISMPAKTAARISQCQNCMPFSKPSMKATPLACRVEPALGRRYSAPLRGTRVLVCCWPSALFASSAMPPMAPIRFEASSGIMISFWFGAVATCCRASTYFRPRK